MRAIGSAIAGNWASEIKLNFEEGLETILTSAWTLGNRSANVSTGLLLKASLRRMACVGSRVADGLLQGKFVREGGCCRYNAADPLLINIKYDESTIRDEIDAAIKGCANSATTDYLSFHALPVEVYAMQELSVNIHNEMLRSSYTKTIKPRFATDLSEGSKPEVRFKRYPLCALAELDSVWNRHREFGVLSGMPLIEMVKQNLTQRETLLADIVNIVCGEWLTGDDLRKKAFGDVGKGCAIEGWLSWSDAQRIGKLCDNELVNVYYNCYV
jgi:hypothetical protein